MKIASQIGRYPAIQSRGNKNNQNLKNKSSLNNAIKTPNFKGGVSDFAFNMLDKGFSVLDKNAMIQVSFVDTLSTNIPRTLVDLKTGLAAAFETCRREFSGLFVNCLMPGLVVGGIAALLPKSHILKGTGVVNSWANGDVIDKLQTVYTNALNSGAADTTKEYVTQALGSLEGLNGRRWVNFGDAAQEATRRTSRNASDNIPVKTSFDNAIDHITQAISKRGKERKSLLKQAQSEIVSVTKAENVLKFNGKPQSNLSETLRDIVDAGEKFNTVKNRTIKSLGENVHQMSSEQISTRVSEAVSEYSSSLKKFVSKKSFIGLALVLGIAASVQTINRAITRKQFSAEGAPIYKDFGKKDTTQKMNEKQKKVFKIKKGIAAAGMYGLAAASMMKKPSVGMFQFSNIFPTMDQCRWIASTTFASRMLGAEDENELRETTVRDIASFSGLYFLGDYVKKGAASAMEALSKTKAGSKVLGNNIVLLNRKKEVAKPVIEQGTSLSKKIITNTKYRAKQFGNWIKNTELKTAAEVSNVNVRNLRNICRVADIAFSFIMLGVLLPKYNRSVTNKKVEAAKLLEENQKKIKSSNNTPKIFKNMA